MQKLIQFGLTSRNWDRNDLARAYGALRSGQPADQIVARNYRATIDRVLSDPDSCSLGTIKLCLEALGYKLVAVPEETPLVIEL